MSDTPKSLLREPVMLAPAAYPTLRAAAIRLPHSPQIVVPIQTATEALDQVHVQLAAVTAERDALLAGINAHNAECESACAARFVGADSRPCRDTYNGRMCPDCPRDWIIDAALRGKEGA